MARKLKTYQTSLGFFDMAIAAPSMNDPLDEAIPQVVHAVAVLGGDPEPIGPETIAELVVAIRAGGSVLLMSDRADLRDYAGREILAVANPVVAGSA